MALKRVLSVDDDEDIRQILETILGFHEIAVITAETGKVAVPLAKEFKPEMILLDVMMPDFDGPATLISLKADPETAPIPVVFMTAKSQAHEVNHLKSLGAFAVIVKPFEVESLVENLNAIWSDFIK